MNAAESEIKLNSARRQETGASHVQPPALEVRQSGISGQGVYALTPIPAGTLVARCQGTIYSTADRPATGHAMQIGPELWLWSDGSHLDDYFNHSCAPNLGFLHGGLELYSLKDIAAGEELCWDYSTSIAEEGWGLECRCGSARCRKTILHFFSLPAPEQARLLPLALQFIRQRFQSAVSPE